ncbi:hypothetical protein FA95DRAFT_1562033 [Auriscalpium vulgare]|uniref:Uncharacterized protein n=1 Tax=Auriscalpium vulgare TaxID=40419 RepID=A0ACB8RLS7_9AGAM|nr:hypothetical protein FA95DRAFT_1562033 [Auriscalpium vulgare]
MGNARSHLSPSSSRPQHQHGTHPQQTEKDEVSTSLCLQPSLMRTSFTLTATSEEATRIGTRESNASSCKSKDIVSCSSTAMICPPSSARCISLSVRRSLIHSRIRR